MLASCLTNDVFVKHVNPFMFIQFLLNGRHGLTKIDLPKSNSQMMSNEYQSICQMNIKWFFNRQTVLFLLFPRWLRHPPAFAVAHHHARVHWQTCTPVEHWEQSHELSISQHRPACINIFYIYIYTENVHTPFTTMVGLLQDFKRVYLTKFKPKHARR